jgi:hypothetical protein
MSALLADFSTEVRRRLDDLDQEVRPAASTRPST